MIYLSVSVGDCLAGRSPRLRGRIDGSVLLLPALLPRLVMISIAQLIMTSDYVCTGRFPVQASAVFLNELIISHTHTHSLTLFLFA